MQPPTKSSPGLPMGDELQEVFDSFIKATPIFTAPRMVINAVPGWGKTSTIAHAPDAVLITARGETGYDALLGAGLVPVIPVAHARDWATFLHLLDSIRNGKVPCKVLGIDTIGAIERLLHEYICEQHFNGDWGDKGFLNYHKGYDRAVPDWAKMLEILDAIRKLGITVVLLSHAVVRPFNDPLVPSYDQWVADLHPKIWVVTNRWADAVLFGNFVSIVDKDSPKAKKGKGIGGTERILYCEHRDAYDAKNRYGMESELSIPNNPALVWKTIWQAIRKESK